MKSYRLVSIHSAPLKQCRPPTTVLVALGCLILSSIGCGAREPFSHVAVSGKVTYEDGSLIPVEVLTLTFIPQVRPIDAKTYPRPGTAMVDKNTGSFSSAATHKANDGLVRGKHKVTLATPAGPVHPSIVPPEYCDPNKTPLEVDTSSRPFELKIRKPAR